MKQCCLCYCADCREDKLCSIYDIVIHLYWTVKPLHFLFPPFLYLIVGLLHRSSFYYTCVFYDIRGARCVLPYTTVLHWRAHLFFFRNSGLVYSFCKQTCKRRKCGYNTICLWLKPVLWPSILPGFWWLMMPHKMSPFKFGYDVRAKPSPDSKWAPSTVKGIISYGG